MLTTTSNKKKLLSHMMEIAKEQPLETEISTYQLLQLIYTDIKFKNGNYLCGELVSETKDMFDLDFQFKKNAKKHGLIIDNSIHANEVLRMPFHIGFLIKKHIQTNNQ